jgi:hypothetical protein
VPITLTLLTLHLRNVREGTDLADRLVLVAHAT